MIENLINSMDKIKKNNKKKKTNKSILIVYITGTDFKQGQTHEIGQSQSRQAV